MLQRTKDWHKAREGRFTASRITELLTNGTRPMTEDELIAYKKREPKGRRKTIDCIGDSLYTYALDAAVESIYGYSEEEKFVSWDMQRGINLEPFAFDFFKKQKELEFLDVSEVGFKPYGLHAGASADGLVSDNSGLEIKCPKRNNYFKIVMNGINELEPKWIDQMQMQMLAADTEKTYFFAYYQEKNKQFGHEIIVDRDEKRIEFIKERLEVAIEVKMDFIKKLKNNLQ